MTYFKITKINGKYVIKGDDGRIIDTSQTDAECRQQQLEMAQLGRYDY